MMMVIRCIYIFIYMYIHGKLQFRGPELFKKKGGHYFKKNFTHLVYFCLHEHVGDMIVDECNFNVFADMILPYSSYCINMTANPEPINSVTGMWLSCFATCDVWCLHLNWDLTCYISVLQPCVSSTCTVKQDDATQTATYSCDNSKMCEGAAVKESCFNVSGLICWHG